LPVPNHPSGLDLSDSFFNHPTAFSFFLFQFLQLLPLPICRCTPAPLAELELLFQTIFYFLLSHPSSTSSCANCIDEMILAPRLKKFSWWQVKLLSKKPDYYEIAGSYYE
jgi:hypothetical protein